MAGAAITRAAFNGKQNFESDVFIGGAATLPIAIWQFLLLLMFETMLKTPVLLMGTMLLCLSLSILMLYAGFTRIHRVSEQVATFMVPATILIAGTLMYYIYLKDTMPSGMRMF